jgi:hypothetical protein
VWWYCWSSQGDSTPLLPSGLSCVGRRGKAGGTAVTARLLSTSGGLLGNILAAADPLMTWRDPAETLRVVVDPAAREPAAKGTDMVLTWLVTAGEA